jgi:hypothetical protein
MTAIDIRNTTILALAQSTCPVTADVAAFPGNDDAKTVQEAHKLVRPARRFYVASENAVRLDTLFKPKTAVNYRPRQPSDYDGIAVSAWLALQLAHPSSNPEVLIVAPEQALPDVYMAVLKEVIEYCKVRNVQDYGKLPRLIPCISGARTVQGLKFEGAGVSLSQLEAYLNAKGLRG